ncbi:MAG TPA: hypothetical protein VGM82_06420 [Gemmatimonadaceae bacterium]|jgi:hypothetical protein
MKSRLGGLLLVVGLAAAPSVAMAQNPFHINVAAGAAVPTGDFGDAADVGYNVMVGIGVRPALSPLGFRVEGKYSSFGAKNCPANVDCGSATVKGVDANLIYDFMPVTKTVGVGFYGIGGLGGFSVADDTHLGWNIGAGLRLPLSGFSGYVEARYHQVQGDGGHLGYIPIVFGLSF